MSYTPRTTARAHQNTALGRIRKRPSAPSPADIFALLIEYGGGKSKIICDEFGEREEARDLQDLLVVAGAGSYRNWDRDKTAAQPSEFHRHMSDDLNDRMRTMAWISGAGVGHHRALERFLTDLDPRRPRAFVVNIEALSKTQKARDAVRTFLQAPGRRAMAVDDESTNIKAWDSKRTEFMHSVASDAAARRILTGLVTPNSPMDLFSQFWFLDWRVLRQRSYYTYRSRYAVLKRTSFLKTDQLMAKAANIPGVTEIPSGRDELVTLLHSNKMFRRGESMELEVSYKNVDELYDLIAPYSYRVLKSECMDLPPKVYMPVREVPLTDEQRRHYKELKQYAITKIENSYASATLAITQMLRMQQLICGHLVDEDGKEHDVPERRTDDLLEVLGEHSGKAIIWIPFQRTLGKVRRRLEEEFGEGCTAEYSGRNAGNARLEDEARWLSDPTCRFMCSTQAAGGRGNTWLPGTLECFFANNYDLELRLNAEDRPHRHGQEHPVAIQDWICPGTIEEKVVPALREKIDIAAAIMGDGYREWLV